jgi:NAD(P) transhydrogenase subunit beta
VQWQRLPRFLGCGVIGAVSGSIAGDEQSQTTTTTGGVTVREIAIDDAALQLAYASKVVIVSVYGLAAAQAQHELVALAEALTARGVEVSYAIHPVAGNAVSGMPILDVDHARSVIVIKRSLGHGYAGIDNDLYADPKTAMLFSDAKVGLTALVAGVHAYVA